MRDFDEFMKSVYGQLECNVDEKWVEEHPFDVLYCYDNEDIERNMDYFVQCFREGLSGYKSLLYFWFYLNDGKDEEGI